MSTECVDLSCEEGETRKTTIKLENVSLCYNRGARFFFSRNKQIRKKRKFWALKNISAQIYENETVGLIGRNGSGKSTISRIISGALPPDDGQVITVGKVQLLALGVGFKAELTGRENIFISGALLGLSKKKIKQKIVEIIEFAELGDFIDEPISTYSAGMKSRLGFAVSTVVEPNILILDEVMSTGDAAFRKKANARMEEMRNSTKTVIIVSHNPSQISEQCDRVLWLEKGDLIMDGITEDVLPVYAEFCENPVRWMKENYFTSK